jgi:hypothetical protein
MLNKKAQQEIVGFIIIMVIVIVIGLFFLVFWIKQYPASYSSVNVQNFLKSSMRVTTDCKFSIDFLDLEDAIRGCYENKVCSNGISSCDTLNQTFLDLIDKSWVISNESSTSAYSLLINYEQNESSQAIFSSEKGDCTGTWLGSQEFFSYQNGNIVINFQICSQEI